MPLPADSQRRYVPGLDGLRAVAVVCVIAYHLGVPGWQGGMLGVGVFFTLSGYLITDLLLAHWHRHASLGLGRFWLHRARRLLPALFVMLAVVSVWVAVVDAGQLPAVRRQVLAALLYVGNWSTIAAHGSYFARFAAPLPLDHLWSLAIEEQFYLLWPWFLLAGIWVTRSRLGLGLLTLCTAAASVAAMSLLYHSGYDPTRVYEGTDTRAFELLIGALLAIGWPSWLVHAETRPRLRDGLDAIGVAGLFGILVLVWRTNSFSPFLYPLGFVLLSVATVAVIGAAINPAARLGPILGWGPLRWVGVRSYAIYLWQWPIIVLINPRHGPLGWTRALLAVAITLAISSLSWRYIEDPIRHGALGRIWTRIDSRWGHAGGRRRLAAISCAVVVIPIVSLSGLVPAASTGHGDAAGPLLTHTHAITVADTRRARARARPSHAPAKAPVLPPATRTSCRSVVYIGDSTSEGEISTDYIPNPRLRLPAQLADVGVHVIVPEISGARSIVETYNGLPNAATVARSQIAQGFRGCWILALGTNDVADVQVGSGVTLKARIARMMSIIGDQPALWVDAVTLDQSGPYAETGMQQWNQDLVAACERYPNARVFDWAAYAKPAWFIPDGIHYYSPGYVARARRISEGLAHAFPEGRAPSTSCVVR